MASTGVKGSGFPPRRSDDRPARRPAEPGAACLRFRAIPRAPRWCCAASTCWKTFWARRLLRRRPTFRRSTRPRSARRPRCGSRWKRTASSAVCASCHSKMDVLGFGLENYDAIGTWRTTGRQIPGGFQRHAAQRQIVRHSRRDAASFCWRELPQFAHCLTEKMLTYALGRGLGPYDRNTRCRKSTAMWRSPITSSSL